jgi:hypothetical protein
MNWLSERWAAAWMKMREMAGLSRAARPFILDDDFETDPDAWANLAYVIHQHWIGHIDLKGIIICSLFNTSPCAVRAALDAYGLGNVPVGWTPRTGKGNPDFYNAKTRDKFGIAGETGASPRFKAAASLYRELLVNNPGVHIVTGGFMNPLVELLYSKPDRYSKKNGVDLITACQPRLFVGLTTRPKGNQASTTGWTGGASENNTALSLAAAVNFVDHFPGQIIFYSFPSLEEFGAIQLPIHVRTANDMEIDPIRYAFVLGGRSIATGDIGPVGPLFDSHDDRYAGDIVQIQAALDVMLNDPTAHFQYSSGGVLSIDPSTGLSAFRLGGHARHRYITLVAPPTAMHQLWQSALDSLTPPTSVNMWRYSDQLYGSMLDGATVAKNSATAPDGTPTADTLTASRYGGHAISFPAAANHAYTHSFFIKKTDGRTRFPCVSAQFLNGSTVLNECGAIINTNSGAGYAASHAPAPGFGSVPCTIHVADGSHAINGTHASEYWFVTETFTAPADCNMVTVYHGAGPGRSTADASRDGAAADVSQVYWGNQFEPSPSYSAIRTTNGECSWTSRPG